MSGKIALLAASLVCCIQLTHPGAEASVVEGWQHSWDSGPVFAETSGGGRILFVRDEVAPQQGPPGGRIMNSTIDGEYVGRQTEFADGSLSGITVPDFVDRFAYVNGKGVCKVEFQPQAAAVESCEFGVNSGEPAYSPDGTRIAYTDEGSIKIASDDSTVVIPVPGQATIFVGSQPEFSADGSRVFFKVSGSSGGLNLDGIWAADSDGSSEPVRLTGTTDNQAASCLTDSDPTWRRAVNTVVFARSASDCPGGATAGIWQIDPDTVWDDQDWPQGEKLTETSPTALEYSEPTASRDGSMIAYTRLDQELDRPSSRIRMIDAGGDRSLSSPPAGSGGSIDAHPTISADGRHVAFQRDIPRGDPSWTSGIFRIDSDGSNQRAITESYSYYRWGGGITGPALKLTVQPKNPVLRKGRTLMLRAKLRNLAKRDFYRVKLCVKTGRRLMPSRPRCVVVKTVPSGRVVHRSFRIERRGPRGKQGRSKATVRAITVPGTTPQASVRIRLR